MQDEEFRELFHRMELRLERVDVKVDNLEKRVTSLESRMDTRFNAIEARLTSIDNRIDNKAGNWTVSLWGSTLAILIAAAFALTRWW